MAIRMKVACVMLMSMVMVLAPYAEGVVSCGSVQGGLAPCLPYLTNGGAVSPRCCAGVRSINNNAKTALDRQATCRCLQSAARSIRGINQANAANLPSKCGVNVPYKIGLSTDCSKVQ